MSELMKFPKITNFVRSCIFLFLSPLSAYLYNDEKKLLLILFLQQLQKRKKPATITNSPSFLRFLFLSFLFSPTKLC